MTNPAELAYRVEGLDEPTRCPKCAGQGVNWRWRVDDRRYPVKCLACSGSGVVATQP